MSVAPLRPMQLLWGAYHWGTDANISKQVDNFMKKAKPDDKTLMALDYEDPRMSLSQAREFSMLLAEKLGRKPVLYSGNLVKKRLGNKTDAFFGSHRLWLAQYGPNPKVQKSWKKYWLFAIRGQDIGAKAKCGPRPSGRFERKPRLRFIRRNADSAQS